MHLELSRKTYLAIRALEELQGRAHIRGCDLADSIGTSTHRLPQVMRALIERDWVDSVPGPRGGYHLKTDPGEISVLQVIDAVEGPIPVDRCVMSGAPCPSPVPCILHLPWSRARETVLTELDSVTFAAG